MSIESKLQALLTASNNTTGETDTTLTDAVQRLIDGYGHGGGTTYVGTVVSATGTLTNSPGITKTLVHNLNTQKIIAVLVYVIGGTPNSGRMQFVANFAGISQFVPDEAYVTRGNNNVPIKEYVTGSNNPTYLGATISCDTSETATQTGKYSVSVVNNVVNGSIIGSQGMPVSVIDNNSISFDTGSYWAREETLRWIVYALQ